MMKTVFKLMFLLAIAAFITQPANGQRLLRKIQQRAQEHLEQKVEDKAVEKIDEKIDEGLDSIIDSMEGDEEAAKSGNSGSSSGSGDAAREARMRKIMKGFGMSGEPVPVENSYSFDHLIQMHVEEFNKKGEKTSEGEFITHLDPNSKSMAYQMVSGDMGEPGQGMFIIDAKNGATIILSEENGEKTGVVYGMGTFFQSIGETYENTEPEETPEAYLLNPNVKKTGRSKKIAGYNCDEYTYSDEESESHIWITTDLKMNTQDFFSTLFKTSLYSHGIPWGYMMEATTDDKETGEKSTMQVTKVDENSNVKFNLADYQITNLGSFQVPVEEDDTEKK